MQKVELKPFPHFMADNAFPKALLTRIRANWPERVDFTPEIPHTYVYDLLRPRGGGLRRKWFWLRT